MDCKESSVTDAATRFKLPDARSVELAGRLRCCVCWAGAALGCHLRRSPRRAASIRIRVQSKGSTKQWEEETETRLISRHGAFVGFQHPVQIGESLHVVHMENGREAQARVAWYRRKRRGQSEAGLEFTDCENFWEVDWDALET